MAKQNSRIPLVAVITRTKDRPALLRRAIQSVHEQTMTSFVHVIINDGGDRREIEKVLQECKRFISTTVHVIHNETSMGMEAASNKAIRSVDSTFIAIHDDDDSWHPDFLKQTTEHLEHSGAMGVVVTTDRIDEEIVDNTIRTIRITRWLPGLERISLYKQCLDNYVTPITFLYRRSAFDTIGYYDEQLPVCADWDFGIRFLSAFDIDFLVSEPALANYHHRPKSKGIEGNSVYVGDKHAHYMNLLRNKYLREDIRRGAFGVGYIMNSLADEREQELGHRSHLLEQVVRLEGHVNYATSGLESRLIAFISQATSVSYRIRQKVHRLKRQK